MDNVVTESNINVQDTNLLIIRVKSAYIVDRCTMTVMNVDFEKASQMILIICKKTSKIVFNEPSQRFWGGTEHCL